ncbi:MAG: hypothetical protein LQ343_001253 [Gyalolechia ehrenbergii]|nr:MAG: hypothetical protein LQ343_001253 [Gyalolechia ehrenbergii]
MGPTALSNSHWVLGREVAPVLDHGDPPKTHPTATHQSKNLQLLADSRDSSQDKPRQWLSLTAPLTPATSATVSPTGSYRQRNPRHVPIVVTQSVIDSVLKGLPDSPDSARGGRSSNRPLVYGDQQEGDLVNTRSVKRPRHIPIVIPDFAQPHNLPPPTPVNSSHSTTHTPPKSPYSCTHIISKMSRPNTSGSRTSTLDSSASAQSLGQTYDGRFQPSSSTYFGDVNSSDSSLNQPEPNGQHEQDENIRPTRANDIASPVLGQQAQANGTGSTNLSGLVCDVHRTTGREPHGLVGATTTILGDKLYVFGGRVLSRRRPPLTADLYELDLARRHWTKLDTAGDVPAPRYFHSVCALGGTKLICYGGMSPATTSPRPNAAPANPMDPQPEVVVMSDIHIYDTPTRMWTYISTSNTPQGRYAHCAAVLPSSAVFASANAPLSAIHHNPASSNPHQGTLGVDLDGTGGAEMIVVGGQDSANHYIEQISVFNLRSFKWTATRALGRSCGAYRSVVAPLTSMPVSRIGLNQVDNLDDITDHPESANEAPSMLIYSNYNFLDVKLELQVRLADGSLVEKTMNSQFSPPGLRFPNGGVLDNHFVVSGTYLTSSKQEYALWALDLKTLTWSRIDAGGNVFSQGSWNRGVLWPRRNTFVILGNRKRSLVEDYNHRRINFSNICMVELEAFGLYDNPRRTWPTLPNPSFSAPVLPPSLAPRQPILGGRPYSTAATELGQMALAFRELSDMDLLAIGGERIPVNSHLLARRWGPYFVQLLNESSQGTASTTASTYQADSNSSNSGTNTLRPSMNSAGQSIASRNSSVTITPSINAPSQFSIGATSTLTGMSSLSNPIPGSHTGEATPLEAPSAYRLNPPSRPRQLYLPHTVLTIKALVHFLYTSSLTPPTHHLCTPQILCSLLQLARPYRIDGLLEAVVERLHQVFDGRNAAAVFNAAAMAAGGGRGTGSLFSAEGVDNLEVVGNGTLRLDEATLGAMTNGQGPAAGLARPAAAAAARPPPRRNQESTDSASDDGASGSEVSAATSMESSSNLGGTTDRSSESEFSSVGGPQGGRQRRRGNGVLGDEEREVWAGGMSCVVGLQKRGLRGLMEGRRMRERGRVNGGGSGCG